MTSRQHRPLRLGLLLIALTAATTLTACPGPQVVVDKPPVETPVVAPEPTLPPVPADLIAKSNIEDFEVDGLRVLLKHTKGSPVVALDVYVDGGAANMTPATAGVENLALRAATTGGTAKYPRETYNARLESMASSISATAGRDYATISMNCVGPFFAATWEIFADVLTAPAFDAAQLEIERSRVVEQIKATEEDPDEYVSVLATELHYANHPYAIRPIGTEANVAAFTRQQLADYTKAALTRKHMMIVVVGDIDRATIEKVIKTDLAAIPAGDAAAPAMPAAEASPSGVKAVTRELPTNYIFGFFAAPAPTHPDYYAMQVATSVLRDRLFEEVRTKRNLTYAVSAGLSARRSNIGYLYVTTTQPNETIKVMYEEVEKMATTPLDAKTLEDLVATFLTQHYMALETNSAQADQLGRAEMLSDGWERSLVFIDMVKQVTPADVMRVVQKYVKDVHWGYVGKPEQADDALLKSR